MLKQSWGNHLSQKTALHLNISHLNMKFHLHFNNFSCHCDFSGPLTKFTEQTYMCNVTHSKKYLVHWLAFPCELSLKNNFNIHILSVIWLALHLNIYTFLKKCHKIVGKNRIFELLKAASATSLSFDCLSTVTDARDWERWLRTVRSARWGSHQPQSTGIAAKESYVALFKNICIVLCGHTKS